MTKITLATLVALLLWAPTSLWAALLEVNIGFEGGSGFVIEKEVKSLQEIRHSHIIMQERDYSCGSAALATIFNYYLGRPIGETEIIRSLLDLNEKKGTLEKVIERKGFSLLDLKQFAESQGFNATGYRLNFEDLIKLGVPAIVPIAPGGYKHFVVFRGADRNRVYLADPSIGNITEPIEEFKKDWYGFTNVALVVLPPGDEKREENPMALSDMDRVFVGQEDIDPFLSTVGPAIRALPWEF